MKKFVFDLQRFDSFSNSYTSNTVISGTSSGDNIYNGGSYVTVAGYAGNDSIDSRGSYVSISGGSGDDLFHLDPYYAGSTNNITLTGGTGNDTFGVDPYYGDTISAVITDFTSSDTFLFDSDFNNSSGELNLSYYLDGGNVVLRNNSGGSASFILTLKGVSSINQIASAKYYRYSGWGGYNETILESTTLGELFSVSGGIYASNATSNTVINGSDSDDSISNDYGDNVTINAGAGSDTIYNGYVNYVSVSGGADNDSIENVSVWHGAIDGGTGDDTIIASYRAFGDSINGGAGSDKISISSSTDYYNGTNTIVGGYGNDTIYGNTNATIGNIYQYTAGDGNDVINSYSSLDTLQIGGGTGTYSSVVSGNNIISRSAQDISH